MDYSKVSLEKHYEWKGKLEVVSRASVNDAESLSLAYTPGVAAPCLEIQKDPSRSFELTRRWTWSPSSRTGQPFSGSETSARRQECP